MAMIGVIGTGSMGGMLIRKFVETGAFTAGDVMASNRSADKAKAIAAATGIGIAGSNLDLVAASDVIFICVKPLEVKALLKELKGVLTADKLVVSIAADVTIGDISALCDARVTRVIPSITSECSKGVSLVAFGDNSTEADRSLVLSALGSISRPVETEEENLELLADLTSCAPAFISSMMHEFALSATRRENISPGLAELLVMETLAGTVELLKNVNSFEEVVTRVATKGGITEEGVKVIRKVAPSMYDELLEVTMAKHDLVKDRIRDQAS
ncbi:MAG TPA: NAD(P)-binding domain-containing protein [Methanotrichaceae archaeon]|nr:NAD(P)-binding domain-containing protein [Methanotrichaceae archaeon]